MSKNVGFVLVALAVTTVLVLGTSSFVRSDASTENNSLRSIDVQIGNKTYPLFYNMSNGGIINKVSHDVPNLSMTMNVTTPSDGILELTFPRELYDTLTFTEHGDPLVFIDGEFASDIEPLITKMSCEQTSIKLPIQSGAMVVELIYADILMNHTHSYPGKIELLKTIEQEGQQYSIRLLTDAKKCDVIFSKEEKKITIDILGRDDSSTEDGTLRVTFTHHLLGGNYTVLVDGEPTHFVEDQFFTKNNTDIVVESIDQDDFTPVPASHISITYPKEATKIEVIGTTALPEFGALSVVIAALSIATVLVVLSRSKNWVDIG